MHARARGPTSTRACGATPLRALLGAALAVSLFVPATAGAASIRSEFFGIVQTPSTLDNQDLDRPQGRPRAHRSLPASVGGDPAPERDDVPVGARGHLDRPSGPCRDPGRPDRLGQPEVGREAQRHVAAADRLGQGQDGVAELPQGRGRALRAERLSTGATATSRTTARAPCRCRSPPYQIWNEPNLKKYFIPYPAPKEYAQLLQLSSNAIKSVDPKAKIVLGGMPGNGDVKAWTFLDALYKQVKVPNVARYFDAAALHPYADTHRARPRPDHAGSPGDEEARRRRDAAVDLGDRLGVGAARQPRDQQGPAGTGQDAHRRLQPVPQPPDGLEHREHLLVPLARPEALAGIVHLLLERSPAQLQPHQEAGLYARSRASPRTSPLPRRRSRPGRRRAAPFTTRPPPSRSSRARPAPPSSAGSTPGRCSLARRPTPRSRRSPTAPTRSRSGQSTPPGT